MALYRCKVCGSPKVVQTTQTGGITYNFAKGLVGQAVLGLGGAVAGLESKTETVYACPDCGAIERGQRKPTLNTLFKIAEALDIKPSIIVAAIEEELENK